MLFLLKINYELSEIMDTEQFRGTMTKTAQNMSVIGFKMISNEISNEEVQLIQPSELNKQHVM